MGVSLMYPPLARSVDARPPSTARKCPMFPRYHERGAGRALGVERLLPATRVEYATRCQRRGYSPSTRMSSESRSSAISASSRLSLRHSGSGL